MFAQLALLSGTLAVVGCRTFFHSSKEHRVIGTIDASEVSGAVMRAPSTVRVGESFDVTVTTRGDSCVRADGADVDVRGLIALIIPRDIVSYAHGCAEYDAPYQRVVKLRFSDEGPGVIRVRALNNKGQSVTTERAIRVTQ